MMPSRYRSMTLQDMRVMSDDGAGAGINRYMAKACLVVAQGGLAFLPQ